MRRLLRSHLVTLLLAAALVSVIGSVASACPTCKNALESQDPTHGGIVKGYFYSILFMMGTPYVVLGLFCGSMYYKVRRARLDRETAIPKTSDGTVPGGTVPGGTVSDGASPSGDSGESSPSTQ